MANLIMYLFTVAMANCPAFVPKWNINEFAKGFKVANNAVEVNGQLIDLRPGCEQFRNARVGVSTSTFITYMDLLGVTDRIKLVKGGNYIVNQEILKKIKENQIEDVGIQWSSEKVLQANLDLLMMGPYDDNEKLAKLGTKSPMLIELREFEEDHPLAVAEWLVPLGKIFGRETQAISQFQKIKRDYLSKIQYEKRHRFILGDPNGSYWIFPKADSAPVKLVEEAGGIYLLSKFAGTKVRIEKILPFLRGDVTWISHSRYKNLENIKKALGRYERFFSPVRVYLSDKRINENGWSDFWEVAPVRPDILIKEVHMLFLNRPEDTQWFQRAK